MLLQVFLTFEVYTGSNQNDPKANAVQNMVQRLAKPFKGKGHTFYIDRYFCAPGIANKLYCKGMNVVSVPQSLKQKKLKKVEHIAS